MNRKIFIICTELNSPTAARRFKTIISTHIADLYVQIVDNVYIVVARDQNATCETLRTTLSTFLIGFKLFIMQTSQNAAWRLTPEMDARLSNIL